MHNSTCSFDGCERKVKCLSLCDSHYSQHRNGVKLRPIRVQGRDWRLRFWEKVEKTDTCWNWVGGRNPDGYGHLYKSRKMISAHRLSWEIRHGENPGALQVDHMCHNRACVNPDHLRLVTNKQNQEHRVSPNPNGKSGVLGVYRNGNVYVVSVGHNGVTHYGGRFSLLSEAEEAAKNLRNSLFTNNTQDRISLSKW